MNLIFFFFFFFFFFLLLLLLLFFFVCVFFLFFFFFCFCNKLNVRRGLFYARIFNIFFSASTVQYPDNWTLVWHVSCMYFLRWANTARKHCWTINYTLRKFHAVKKWYEFLTAREELVAIRHGFHTNISHVWEKYARSQISCSNHAYSLHR